MDALSYLSAIALCSDCYVNCLVHATPVHPSLCLPHSNPTVTVTITIAPISLLMLLLLLLCCCYYKLLLLINFCEQELFPGAAELTTQLLRLINILWLPLCRINKLGFTSLENTAIHPLYLWVIKTIFWHRCRGLKCYWRVELVKETSTVSTVYFC